MASYNNAMIGDLGKQYGFNLGGSETDSLLNQTGGDYGKLVDYFTKRKTQADNDAALAALPGQQKAAMDARFAQDKGELTDFNTRFTTGTQDLIKNASDKYSVGTLLGQANALNTRTANISGNLTNEGAGGYATAGQVDKAIQTNYLPRAQTATTNAQNAAQLAAQEVETGLTPYKTEASLLNDRLAREATGYDSGQQRELDALVQKIKNGIALTEIENNRAYQLAQAENEKLKIEQSKYVAVKDGLYDSSSGSWKVRPSIESAIIDA